MNGCLTLLLAAALSAGNVEFDQTARDGAASVAIARIEAELASKGPPSGALERAMLEGGAKFASCQEAKELCRGVFAAALEAEFAARTKAVCERLGMTESSQNANVRESGESSRTDKASFATIRSIREDSRFEALFERAFAAERKSACEKQAKGIAGAVKPSEADVEAKDEKALREEMTQKVAAQQKTPVFEENLRYISEKIVDPVLASARRELKRQREYLTRTKCEAYAPSALAKEIEANLRKNVAERQAKETNPAESWGVFPKAFAEGLPAAVEKRTLERVAKNVDDVAVSVEPADILKTMAADPAAHRKADESEKIFRGIFTAQVLDGACAKAAQEAPEKEREEFAAYAKEHAASPEIVRAVEARVRREVLPKWREVRAAAAKQEADRIWPTLGDRTWYPDAAFADQVVARSDYAAAVKAWRTAPELATLARADGGKPLMEETAADADRSVSAAFDLARSAIAAQTAIVGEVEPSILGEAKDLKASFWRKTPNLQEIVQMLTEAVESRWGETRQKTLWGDGERPANADEQHAALFPSVKRQIELVAREIFEAMEKSEEAAAASEGESGQGEGEGGSAASPDEPQKTISISVSREGDRVKVSLSQDGTTVAERVSDSRNAAFQDAMKFISEKLGRDVLKLK